MASSAPSPTSDEIAKWIIDHGAAISNVITSITTGLTDLAAAFVKSDVVQNALTGLGDGLERIAKYVGSDDFKEDIQGFVDEVKALAYPGRRVGEVRARPAVPRRERAAPVRGRASQSGAGACGRDLGFWDSLKRCLRPGSMKTAALLQLGAACALFIVAASSAKAWALSPSAWRLLLTLALYTAGNLLMLRLIREIGMATAFSVSAVLQLLAVNAVAIILYGEKIGTVEGIGLAFAVVAVVLITFAPKFG